MARTGKYKEWLQPDNLLRIEAWARDGLTDEQIANNIGIRRSTLYDWKKNYPDFSDALKRGKDVVDIEVENAMVKSAIGYEYEEVKTFIEEAGGKKKKKVEKTTKHVTPSVTAQIFWLKNRKPEIWREKQSMEHSGVDGRPIETKNTEILDVSMLSDKELETLESIYDRLNDRLEKSETGEGEKETN